MDENDIPLCDTPELFSYNYYTPLFTLFDLEQDTNFPGDACIDFYVTCILDAKYEEANFYDDAFGQHHLLLDQWCQLFHVLSKHKKLIDGWLGVYLHKKVYSKLKPRAGLPLSQDKFLNVPLHADWHTILAHWEQLVNDGLLHSNKKHININHQVGQKVLEYDKTLKGKFKPKTTDYFEIL